jgi:hypothetical protein
MADFHRYPFQLTGQRSDLMDTVPLGMRQQYDLYTNSAGYTASSYPSMEPVQPNHSAYNNARPPMMPSSSLGYDAKNMHSQDILNRPQVHYGFQESFQGGSSNMRMIHQEQSRDPVIHVHQNHFSDRRPMYTPFQQSALRETSDNKFVSLFGSSIDRDSFPPQDPYTNIQDIRTHDPYRTNVIPGMPQFHLVGEHSNQYALNNLTDMSSQSYRDPRFSYPNMNGNGLYQRHEQDFVQTNNLYAFPKPSLPLAAPGDGIIRHTMEQHNIAPINELHVFHDRPVPTASNRIDEELILKQSSLHISSQQTVFRDTRQYLEMEGSRSLNTSGSNNNNPQSLSDPLNQLQLESTLIPSTVIKNDSGLFTTTYGNTSGKEVSLHSHDDVCVKIPFSFHDIEWFSYFSIFHRQPCSIKWNRPFYASTRKRTMMIQPRPPREFLAHALRINPILLCYRVMGLLRTHRYKVHPPQ